MELVFLYLLSQHRQRQLRSLLLLFDFVCSLFCSYQSAAFCLSLFLPPSNSPWAKVPYDAAGKRSEEQETVLDLTQGMEVVTRAGRQGRVIR